MIAAECWEVQTHHQHMHGHHSLCSTCLYTSCGRANLPDAAGGEEEPSDNVGKSVDAPVSFKSDLRKHFGLPASRNDKGEKK